MSEIIANGSSFTKILLTVSAAGIIGGAAALWSLTSHIATLEERIAAWTKLYDNRFQGIQNQLDTHASYLRDHERAISRNTPRIDTLEREKERK